MAQGQNQMDTIFSKITKCIDHLNSMDGPEKLTEKSLKDSNVLKPVNGYIDLKEDLRICLEFLQGQFGPGVQLDDTQQKVAHCLGFIRGMTISKRVTGEMLKNKKVREELNGYINLKEQLVECFYFLQEQFETMLPNTNTPNDVDKIQSVRPENETIQNKICIAETAKPMKTAGFDGFRKLIQNRLEVEQLKERLAKSTKLVLIDELVEPVKKNLKSFKEQDLIDLLVQRNADLMDRYLCFSKKLFWAISFHICIFYFTYLQHVITWPFIYILSFYLFVPRHRIHCRESSETDRRKW